MASLCRVVFRPAQRVAARSIATTQLLRPLSTTTSFRASVSDAPPQVDSQAQQREMGVGELEGADFKIEPMRRVGEDEKTMRARLVYQSRKRGTLESDLLLSTFADRYLSTMTRDQMAQYDRFLDENDWDIYYWATQEEEGQSASGFATPAEDQRAREPGQGEWAQTVGTFRPAYRPVPARWRDSEVLRLLREHVRRHSKGGEEGGGMGFMPKLRSG